MPFSVSFILLLIIFGYVGYKLYKTTKKLSDSNTELKIAKEHITNIEGLLASTTAENTQIRGMLTEEQARNLAFQQNIQNIQSTVTTLVKLKNTDPELLEKYSKVYFLNENYSPSTTTNISPDYLYDKNRTLKIHAGVWPFMQKMLDDAKKDGITIKVASAYRSFNEQSSLKSAYKVTYGSGANTFSADQGYSEHQLGTTADFTTTTIGGNLVGFEKTDAYVWLQNNAYKYGFILSYPKDNSYYIFEPWHWRFVSIALAKTLHDNAKSFYDYDQRSINFYLVSFFDETF